MFPSSGGSVAGGIPTIPGEPGTLSGAADRLGAAASAVRDWGSRLGSVTSGLSGTTWSGRGSVSFASCVSTLQAEHGSASSALLEASTALSAFATVLAECQSAVTAAQAQVADAQAAASSAISQLGSTPLPAGDPAAVTQRAYSESAVQIGLEQATSAALARAQAAWDQYEAGAARAAAQISSALPSWSALATRIGWLNDRAGFGLVPIGIGFLAPLARAGVRYFQTDNVVRSFENGWHDDNMGGFDELYESGQMSLVELLAREEAYQQSLPAVRSLFGQAALDDVGAGGITPEMRFATPLTTVSRFMAGAAVVSDVATFIKPDDPGAAGWVDRSMATANGVLSLDGAAGGALSEFTGSAMTSALGGVATIDLTTGWVPVAGQIVLAGTALYLAGDWAYNNVRWFHDGVDDVGHTVAHLGDDAGHDLGRAGDDVAHFFGL
jgi:hypothetical protein